MPDHPNLVEVLCSVRFKPEENVWDSTYFGKYHEVIVTRGYTDKREEKKVEFQFQIGGDQKAVIKESKNLPRMVFTNPALHSAIIIGEHLISFHKLAPYTNWEDLIETVVMPGIEDYHSIGLGHGIVLEVQCLYLNKYSVSTDGGLSQYLNFLPNLSGVATGQLSFQGVYEINVSNSVHLRLNTTPPQALIKEAFFECSSFAKPDETDTDYLKLAARAHDNVNRAYHSIIVKS